MNSQAPRGFGHIILELPKIVDAVEALGPTRVLYGSDMPVYHPRSEIDKVRLSGLSEDLVDRVLDKNARALFLKEGVA